MLQYDLTINTTPTNHERAKAPQNQGELEARNVHKNAIRIRAWHQVPAAQTNVDSTNSGLCHSGLVPAARTRYTFEDCGYLNNKGFRVYLI